MGEASFGTQEVKMVDRSNISITGVNKIVSFDDEEFLMETVMGNLRILGNGLELLKLDTLLHICEGFGITITEFFENDIFKEVEQD